MDKTIAGVLGALGTLAVSHAASAAPDAALQANSYADLLKPIPNAVELLASDALLPTEAPMVQEVQYHHHHHHRRRVVRCYWHHHHRVCRYVYY